jgi:cell division septal protein FtsQ
MAKGAVRQERVIDNLSTTRLRTKKRARDISKTIVSGLLVALVIQLIGALYYSPILSVTADSLSVTASLLCPESNIRGLLEPDLPRSIMRLPTQRWIDALENIPAVKSASIKSGFPNRVAVKVIERQPRLQADLGELGKCVLDTDLVPFRLAETKDNLLPIVELQPTGVDPKFGTSIVDKSQIAGVITILTWISKHPNVSANSISIQNKHLSFVIRSSNVNVLLGTPRRLEEKLDSLDVIIKKRPEILETKKYAAVNLFSDEYPALVLRSNSSDKSAVP